MGLDNEVPPSSGESPPAPPAPPVVPPVVAPPVLTPVSLRGRLVWEQKPQDTSGFEGFTVLATFAAREGDDPVFVPRVASVTLSGGNGFTVGLPAREQLADAPVEVAAKYPDGQMAASASVTVSALGAEVTLKVAAPQPIVVRADARADEAQGQRLKGKVVDLAGEVPISHRQVTLWGQPSSGGVLQPVLVTTTDQGGNFAGPWPKTVFARGFATVAGTRQATPEAALAVALDPVAAGGDADVVDGGTFPLFVYLVVSVDAKADVKDDCACRDGTAPRQPDPEDLVANPDAYSQDIGPSCVNFTTPNRTLEEFVYTLVVRTTDPEIKGTTVSDLEQRHAEEVRLRGSVLEAALTPLQRTGAAFLPALAQSSDSPSTVSAVQSHLSPAVAAALAALSEDVPAAPSAAAVMLPPGWWRMFKTVAARGELTAQNSVDWDGSPTFYQAATIAHGHVLTYKQIWKADGYSLGDLLYSLPLAPGQKKQVVIFDWDRSEFGRRDEATHEDEALDSYLSRNRDLIDITHASLSEHLKGGSTSRTSGSAGGIGGGIGALLGPVMIGVAGGYSSSSGSASSSAWQDSSRNISASGLNQLRDLMQQGASAVRNQRSTVVQTARQTERFKVESEVVANHNHCHAITIEYFEVLRHYAIEQQLTEVEECLFIPLLMSPFDLAKVMRWRDILRAALRLPPRPRALIFQQHPLQRGIGAVERIYLNYEGSDFPATTYAAESLVNLSGELRVSFRLNRPLDDDDNADDPARQDQFITMATLQAATGWNVWWPLLSYGPNETWQQFFANQKIKYKNKIFEERVAPVLAEAVVGQLTFTAVTATGGRIPLALDPTLVSSYQRDVELYVSVRPKGPINVRRDQIDYIEIATSADLSASAQSKIIVRRATFRYSTPHFNAYLAQDYRVDNDLLPNDPVVIYTPLSTDEKRNPRKEDKQFSKLLIEHLNAHLEYYHKAIWAQMDPDRRYMLLDGFVAPNANGKSVASVVENRVIGVAGNCLIMPVAPGYKLDPTYTYEPMLDAEGRPVLDERGQIVYQPTSLLDHYKPLTPPSPYRVSVPTRGVFAEAVMGACNSCEKWDESRYWKWEEHPIPEEPTPIAPIQTQPPQRSEPGALTPTPFPTPMINIQNAPEAPEPGATVTGALGLLGKSDLFKDITGLDQTQKNALQAMLSNQESAKHFADKAAELAVQGANLKSAPTTVDSIKKSMADGTIDKATGQHLIADAYRAQITGKTAPEQPINTAARSELGHAAADAVKTGRDVKATQTHPDGTTTTIEQKPDQTPTEGQGSGKPVTAAAFPFTAVPVVITLAGPKNQMPLSISDALNVARTSNKIAPRIRIAVFDMTDTTMEYGGLNDDDMVFTASLQKITALAAAYALREALRAAVDGVPAASPADLIAAVETAWRTTVEGRTASRPKDFPKLSRIFEISAQPSPGKWNVLFKSDGKTQSQLEPFHEKPTVDTLPFFERMVLMTQFSDNLGAGLTIRDLGFQYIMGTMVDLGFFNPAGFTDPARDKGLWLSKDYIGGRWGVVPDFTGQRANAKSVATFFAALGSPARPSPAGAPHMISDPTSMEIANVLNNHWTRSFVEEGVDAALGPQTWNVSESKIGLYEQSDLPATFGQAHEGGYFERKASGGRTVKYAIAILNGTKDTVRRAAAAVDDIIDKRNRP